MAEFVRWLQSHETLLWVAFLASLLMFLATLAIVPMLVIRIPADYFAPTIQERRRRRWSWSPLRMLWHVVKNVLGLLLIIAGLAMLVLPGQGLLTIVVGVMLLDFPGKYSLERRIVSIRRIERAINWLRRRAGRRPLQLDDDPSNA